MVSLESLSGEDGAREFEALDQKATLEMEISAEVQHTLSMLDSLEPQYREIIHFRYVEGLPPKDIAEILELSTNTVSVRLTRAVETLRKLMGIQKNNHE